MALLLANDINDIKDELITDDIVRYIPSVVQRQWQDYKLFKNRKYFVMNRLYQNDKHNYFLERDYYRYELEFCKKTIDIIRENFLQVIGIYLKRDISIGEKLKKIYNDMMIYLNKDLINYNKKYESINY